MKTWIRYTVLICFVFIFYIYTRIDSTVEKISLEELEQSLVGESYVADVKCLKSVNSILAQNKNLRLSQCQNLQVSPGEIQHIQSRSTCLLNT